MLILKSEVSNFQKFCKTLQNLPATLWDEIFQNESLKCCMSHDFEVKSLHPHIVCNKLSIKFVRIPYHFD